jgi:hypothetical protein
MNYYISSNAKLPSTDYVQDTILLQNPMYANIDMSIVASATGLVLIANVSNTQPSNTSIRVVEKDNTGNLYMTWIESSDWANTQSDMKASTIARIRRNTLLAASDWTQMADAPAGTAAKWAPYREALRNLPSQNTFPRVITWPSTPV